MELIDRDVYRKEMVKYLELMARAGDSQNDIACGMKRALRLLDMQDVVDANHVVRGNWMKRGNEKKCSCCAFIYYSNNDEWNFCPNCGAKMDGKELGK